MVSQMWRIVPGPSMSQSCTVLAGLDLLRRQALAAGAQAAGRLAAFAGRAGRVLEGDRPREQPGVELIGLMDHVRPGLCGGQTTEAERHEAGKKNGERKVTRAIAQHVVTP